MLESLSGFSKREAQGILSSVTLSLLPNPSSEPRRSIDEALYRRVLAESREKLSVDPSDETTETRSRVVDFLGNQISESILRGVDVDRIKSRLGENGYLRPDEYEIKSTPETEQFLDVLRMQKTELLDAINSPDEAEHLTADILQDGTSTGLSLFTKSFGTGHDSYILIVGLERVGHTLEPHFFYRAYFSDVDIQSAHSPLEVLRAFINRYGIRFQLGNLPATMFYQREVLPYNKIKYNSTAQGINKLLHPLEVTSDSLTSAMVRTIPSLELVCFTAIFLINLARYRKDLAGHDIKIASAEEMLSKQHINQMNKNLLSGRSIGNKQIARRGKL